MRAELGGDVRGVGHHVHRGLPLLAQPRAPGIRPDHDREPRPLGLFGDLPELLIHLAAVGRARVDGVADPAAPEAKRLLDTGGQGGHRVGVLAPQQIVAVELEDQRDGARELGRARLQEPQRGRIRAAAGFDGQLEVVAWVVACRVWREAARRPVFESLIHRQDHHPPGARQGAVIQQAGQVGQRPAALALIVVQDLTDAPGHARPPPMGPARGRPPRTTPPSG